MRLIFHGELRKLYGKSATMQSRTIRDALEGFSRQQENWPREMMVEVIGHNTEESLLEYVDEVHLMPSMRGGGGKFGSILVGAVLVIGAVVANVLTGGALTPLEVSLIVAGSSMALMGIVNLFMKAPTVKATSDPDASKYLSVNVNTTAVNTPIVMAWGLILLAGQWLSLNSDSSNLAYGVFPATPT